MEDVRFGSVIILLSTCLVDFVLHPFCVQKSIWSNSSSFVFPTPPSNTAAVMSSYDLETLNNENILARYFKDPPMYSLMSYNYEKAEEAFHRILTFNKRQFSGEIRIRPARITDVEENTTMNLPYSTFFRSKPTKHCFLALLWLWFFSGVSFTLLAVLIMSKPLSSDPFVHVISLSFCHLLTVTFVTVLCHWIGHKKILCAFLLLKNISIVGTMLMRRYCTRNRNDQIDVALKLLCFSFLWAGLTTQINLTPRMLPTSLRCQGVGMCISVFYFGQIFVGALYFLAERMFNMWASISFLLILGIFSETYCCLSVWNVHNRELPDFVEDCIYFQRYFKPRRYVCIQEKRATLQEIEVNSVAINEEGHIIE